MMHDMDLFVDAIINGSEHHAYSADLEEDQKLPCREALSEVLRILMNVSCMREEGRYSTFRVCFISPDSTYLDAYIYSQVFLFSESIDFNIGKLHKLTPALNADSSYLMLDVREKPYKIIGILAAHSSLYDNIMNFSTGGTRMPRIPNILVKDPGKLEFCFGETPVVTYSAGEISHFRTDTFTSTIVADKLRDGSRITEEDRLRLLYKIIRLITSYGHGGHLIIVPGNRSLREIVDIKYRLPAHLLEDNRNDYLGSDEVSKKTISLYADIVARLSCVDGGVVLNRDMDLIGFGSEAIVNLTSIKPPSLRFVASDGHIEANKRFDDNGMRHRACYRFCELVEDSVVIIFSQDGSIKACTKDNGEVVVFEDVGIPFI